MPSLLAALDVPGYGNPLGVEPLRRACVLVADGLGWELLLANRRAAPAMAAAAAHDELGSAANPDIRPPGLNELPARNRARAHLLGRQLGGSGDLQANLVALYQTRANTPGMRD